MKSIVAFFADLHSDDSGAAFIEYTALLGVILAVGLIVLLAVGGWATQVWTALCTNLGTATAAVGATCDSTGGGGGSAV